MMEMRSKEPYRPSQEESTVPQLKELGELKAQGVVTKEEFRRAEGKDSRLLRAAPHDA